MSPADLIAIIPARGGSKRLPRKNLLPLAGKPLIAWTIEAAIKSRKAGRVVVSTDDLEIAEVSKSYGAEVPFMRPQELAADDSTTVDVVLDVLNRLNTFSHIMLLQPTSPLRDSVHIEEAVYTVEKHSASAVVSVSPMEHPTEWANTIPSSGSMDKFLRDEIKNKRSQDFPLRYRINGAIFIIEAKLLIEEHTFLPSKGAYAFHMARESAIDIDSKVDLMVAEVLMQDRITHSSS